LNLYFLNLRIINFSTSCVFTSYAATHTRLSLLQNPLISAKISMKSDYIVWWYAKKAAKTEDKKNYGKVAKYFMSLITHRNPRQINTQNHVCSGLRLEILKMIVLWHAIFSVALNVFFFVLFKFDFDVFTFCRRRTDWSF